MRAVTWQGKRDVRVEDVPDPTILEDSDAIVRVTSTAICGSDLHLYEVLGPYMDPGDILGHETMGVVEAVGSAVTSLQPGDRVVVPFGIACGGCWMCTRGLYAHCETTQNREQGTGASLFGYSRLYGSVPGGQAERLRVPYADVGPVVVPDHGPDERYLFLSDVLPTAWQAVRYADVPADGTLVVLGLGPIGRMCMRVARTLGVENVVGVDVDVDRVRLAQADGFEATAARGDELLAQLRGTTDGRGADAVIDAVGMEACGSPGARLAQHAAGTLPAAAARWVSDRAAVDRLAALETAITVCRRGGTVSVSGVYGGRLDPLPMRDLFDKGLQLRMGQAHVRRWIPEILPYVLDDADPLGTLTFASHRWPLERASEAYDMFQHKRDDCFKVVLDPALAA